MSDREELLQEIRKHAVVHGDFVLSSGQRATWYIDLRRVLLTGRTAPLAGRVMLDVTADLSYEAVGGLTLGADPVAAAMMHAAAQRGQPLDAFVVRKAGKAHGLQRRIEGPDVAGRRVLAVEDTSTTGTSVLTAVEALREAGAEVVGVAVMVERGARPRVARPGCPTAPPTSCPTWAWSSCPGQRPHRPGQPQPTSRPPGPGPAASGDTRVRQNHDRERPPCLSRPQRSTRRCSTGPRSTDSPIRRST